MKRILQGLRTLKIVIICGLATLFPFVSSSAEDMACQAERHSIVVLFENDVHCAVNGYCSLAGLRDAVSDTAYAAVVSSGDFLQGGAAGAVSRGQYIIDIMNSVGYDAVGIGNHEFDYRTPRLRELSASLNAPIVCCNLYDMTGNRLFMPYTIRTYGGRRIAFVGVLTPDTQDESESFAFYDAEGTQLYDTRRDNYTQLVQEAVDKARGEGADYVILLAHLGERQTDHARYTSTDLIASTNGIDAVLDGHTHSVVNTTLANNQGRLVILCQTGTQFANIGKLLITKDGTMTATLIPTEQVKEENASVKTTTEHVNTLVDEQTGVVVFHSEVPLLVTDGSGNRMVRKAETNGADLVTDAMRHSMDADICMINGGAIRTDISAGDVRYKDIIDMLPFEDYVWKIEVPGRLIHDALEAGAANLPCESGNFVHVSGMRYAITGKHVSEVQVMQRDGTYAPLDTEAVYSVAVLDYCVTGGGFSNIFKGCRVTKNSGKLYRDIVVDYVNNALGGNIGTDYAMPQGRIMVRRTLE